MKSLFAAALVAASLVLTGCGVPPAGPEPDPVADPVADPQPDPEAETDAGEAAEATADAQTRTEADEAGDALVLYSGRSESLVGPLIERFTEETGIAVDVRWGNTGELAATLLEEGAASPADAFFAQDPGGLGAVEALLAPLPEDVLGAVDPGFRDPERHWVGTSGRARVLVYNTEALSPDDLPDDIRGLTDPAWRGRIGWAPTNASFQTMVTAMRAAWGEDEARAWVAGMVAGEPATFDGNAPIVAAVGAGEIDLGLVNHYYLYRFLEEEGEGFAARNHFMDNGGPESLVMVAGAGVLASAAQPEAAQRLVAYLVAPEAQAYFVGETFEYPVRSDLDVALAPDLPPIDSLAAPDLDLADLADLQGTVALLREAGALP